MSEQHDAAAEQIIAAELTRAVLGGVEHPELRTDVAGALARFAQRVVADLLPALERFDAAITAAGRRLADEAERAANDPT